MRHPRIADLSISGRSPELQPALIHRRCRRTPCSRAGAYRGGQQPHRTNERRLCAGPRAKPVKRIPPTVSLVELDAARRTRQSPEVLAGQAAPQRQDVTRMHGACLTVPLRSNTERLHLGGARSARPRPEHAPRPGALASGAWPERNAAARRETDRARILPMPRPPPAHDLAAARRRRRARRGSAVGIPAWHIQPFRPAVRRRHGLVLRAAQPWTAAHRNRRRGGGRARRPRLALDLAGGRPHRLRRPAGPGDGSGVVRAPEPLRVDVRAAGGGTVRAGGRRRLPRRRRDGDGRRRSATTRWRSRSASSPITTW